MASLPIDSPLWVVQPEQRTKYEVQFRNLTTETYATGDKIKSLMMMSGLPAMVLAKIWSLSDVDVDGKMDVNEFSIALHLIALKMKGYELPEQLPPALINLVKTPATAASFDANASINRGMSQSASASSNISRGSTTPTSTSSPAIGEWAIPPIVRRKYTQLFNQHDRNRTGHLSGLQAKNILVETKLPQTTLASLWNLADVDADGKLSCDEFILCMFLVDKAKNNEILPLKLPAELIPPSYRRSGSVTGALSHHSSMDDANMDDAGGKATFEDKRRENYEKGQAELDRRRQAIMEQEKRAKEERERKEREEAARKEKIRLEEERRKQEEIERAQLLQRQKQLELEEQKRRAQEVRDLARREMERQRQAELEKQHRTELMNARSRLAEEVQKLKARRKLIGLEHEKVDKQIMEGKTNCKISRERIVRVKSDIDGMRSKRDEIIAKQNAIKNQIKALTDQTLFIEQEKVRLSTQVKTLFANAGNGANEEQITSFDSMLQAKRLAINQLKAHIERYEQEGIQKQHDLTSSRRELDELRRRFEAKRSEAKSYSDLIEAKRQEAEASRDGRGHSIDAWSANVPANFEWPATAEEGAASPEKAPPVATVAEPIQAADVSGSGAMQTKYKYRCVFAYEARNADEISINPGDIVMVDTSAASEPDWLSGEVNGKVGWFPAAYAELADENASDTNAHVRALDDAFAPTKISEDTAGTADAPKQGTVIFDYPTTEEGYLDLKKGDIVRVTSEDGAWVFGDLLNTTGNVKASGWFPDGYLDFGSGSISGGVQITTTTVATVDASQDDDYYLSLYAFESQQDGDLEFAVDELIKVEKKDGEWWTGVVVVDRQTGALSDTRRGVFPSNFVTPAPATAVPFDIHAEKSGDAPTAVSAEKVTAAPPTPEPMVKAHAKLDRKESEGVTSSPKPKKSKAKSKAALEIVTAIAPYTASGPEQLTLEVGQLIQVRKKIDSGWWEGELQAKGKKKQVGWFPASYVKPLGAATGLSSNSTPEPPKQMSNSPASTVGASAEDTELERVVAFYSFKAEREDELTIEIDDVIRVLAKPDPTWWRGHNTRTNSVGLFPSNHVQSEASKSVAGDAYRNYSPTNNYYDHVPYETTPMVQSKSEPVNLNLLKPESYSVGSFDSDSEDDDDDEFEDDVQDLKNHKNNNNNSIQLLTPDYSSTTRFDQLFHRQQQQQADNRGTVDERRRKFRDLLVELFDTEIQYVESLQFTLEHFRKPLLDSSLIVHIPREEIESYFSQMDSVLRVNRQFYSALRDCIRPVNQSDFMSIFEVMENFFQKMLPVYENYCYEQGKSSRKLQQRIDNDKIFKNLVDDLKVRSGSGLPLSSFLLKPMQRITKYPLFLSRILKVTDAQSQEYSKVEQVFNFSQTLCKQINEKCKMLEMLDIFGWLETHISYDVKNCDQIIYFGSETQFLGPRTLLFSGVLNKLNSKILVAFLFNDFLLFATPTKRSSKITPNANFFNQCHESVFDLQFEVYRKPLLLDNLSIVDQKSDSNTNWHPQLFRLMIHSSKRQIVLGSNSQSDCEMWIKAIQRAKTAYCDNRRRHVTLTVPKGVTTNKPQCILFITVLEGSSFYTNNLALNAYCRISVGPKSAAPRFTEVTKPVRVELNGKGFERRLSFEQFGSIRSSKSLNHIAFTEPNLKVQWHEAFRIFLETADQVLRIEAFDQNPFGQEPSIGVWEDSLTNLGFDGYNLAYSQPRPIVKYLKLKVASQVKNLSPTVQVSYSFLPIDH